MKNKLLSYLIISWLFTFSVVAQDANLLIENNFPTSWVGDWVGELQIYSGMSLQQSLPMQLIIQPTGDTIHQGDTIPAVQIFPMRVYQKCVLSKI